MTHTPGPWRTGVVNQEYVYSMDRSTPICQATGMYSQSTRWDNARFIVTSCNAHDQLLEACKLSLARLLQYDYSAMQPTIEKLKAAIAKAEGE